MEYREWLDAAVDAVVWCADNDPMRVTSDEVWARLEQVGVVDLPDDPKKPGVKASPKRIAEAFAAAARAGVVVNTGRAVTSQRGSRNHGKVTLWVAAGMAWRLDDAVPVAGWQRARLERVAERLGVPLVEVVAKALDVGLDTIDS